jgi:hypothetical protein
MRKLLTSLLLAVFLFSTSAFAMGSGDKYVDAQTGLTYKVYKPTKTLGMAGKSFQLINCQPGEDDWIYVRYGGTARYLEIMQTKAGIKCSDPGVAKALRPVVINGAKAKVYVYCDPAKPASFKKCGTKDFLRVGGYLMFKTKAGKTLKGTEIQVQGSAGITYAQLVSVAKGLKAVG